MKQKDIALLILVAGISAAVSFVASNLLFQAPQNRQQQIAVVDPITTEFTTPSSKFFNSNSIDPARLIEVGANNNSNPFSSSGH